MALTDDVTARFSTDLIRRLTNPDAPHATTSDTTKLANAATDVQADFEVEAGVLYDGGKATHVSVGVDGVVAKLAQRGGKAGAEGQRMHDAYIERLRSLRGRATPATTSLLDPTVDQQGDRPWADDRVFEAFVPRISSQRWGD